VLHYSSALKKRKTTESEKKVKKRFYLKQKKHSSVDGTFMQTSEGKTGKINPS
jgi:hypothetical protein